jgi:hypothetical protein
MIATTVALAVMMKMPHWTAILAIAALLQWLAFAVLSVISAEKPPKFGMRIVERNLLVSSAVIALVWLVAFDAKGIVFGSPATADASSVITQDSAGGNATCAAVSVGMAGADVKSKLGEPKVLSEEDTRGPGAKLWFFKKSRCAVHMLDDVVEFID